MSKYLDWDARYCNHRLSNSFVRSEGRLWQFSDARDERGRRGPRVNLYHPGQDQQKQTYLSELELEPPRLGFVNCDFVPEEMARGGGGLDGLLAPARPRGYGERGGADDRPSAVYVRRAPVRRDWRQGIRAEQLRLLHGGRLNFLFQRGNYRNLEDAVFGRYPSLEKALADVEEYYKKAAISRAFAIDDNFDLHYADKPEPVGKIVGANRVRLNPGANFLKERIEKETALAVLN